jgi:O-antigen/teichoic acid export membrane protein
MLSQGIASGYQRLPLFAVGWLFGPTTAGLYVWADRFAVLPAQFIAIAIGDVYRQRATAMNHAYGRFDALMLRTVKVTAALAVLPYALGIWLAPTIFAWMFGPSWHVAGEFASILMIGGFFSFVFVPVDKAAVIRGRTGYILLWQSARLLGKVVILLVVVATDAEILTFLWLLVALRIALYLIDFAYELHLAHGDASERAMPGLCAAPRLSSPAPITTRRPRPT